MELKDLIQDEKILSQIINLNKQLNEKTAIKIREIAATALNDFETYFSAEGFKTIKSENTIKAVYGTKSAFLRHEDFNHNYAGTELPFDLEFKFNKNSSYRLGIFNDEAKNPIRETRLETLQYLKHRLENFANENWYFMILDKNYTDKRFSSIKEVLDCLISKM